MVSCILTDSRIQKEAERILCVATEHSILVIVAAQGRQWLHGKLHCIYDN